jgi:hypothetical protein
MLASMGKWEISAICRLDAEDVFDKFPASCDKVFVVLDEPTTFEVFDDFVVLEVLATEVELVEFETVFFFFVFVVVLFTVIVRHLFTTNYNNYCDAL